MTLSGLIAASFHAQGRRQNTPPTLGFVMQRLQRCETGIREKIEFVSSASTPNFAVKIPESDFV
jgi:hypothetical protein